MSKQKNKEQAITELKELMDAAKKAYDSYNELMQVSIKAGVPNAEEVMKNTCYTLKTSSALLTEAYNDLVVNKITKPF